MRLALALWLMSYTGSAATLIKLACGGPGGADWSPDSIYNPGGSVQAVAGNQSIPYNNLRYALSGASLKYLFPLAPGVYFITLHFIESRATQTPGKRIFSVAINGSAVLPDLDLFVAAGGSLIPKSYTMSVTSAAGPITMVLTSSVGNSVISGIEIATPVVAPPPPTVANNGLSVVCNSGVTRSSDLTPGAKSQQVTISAVLNTWRFIHVRLCQLAPFFGVDGLTVSMEPGLTGPIRLPMPDNYSCYSEKMVGPDNVVTDKYDISLAFNGATNFSTLTSGSLAWEFCGFDIVPGVVAGACTLPNGCEQVLPTEQSLIVPGRAVR